MAELPTELFLDVDRRAGLRRTATGCPTAAGRDAVPAPVRCSRTEPFLGVRPSPRLPLPADRLARRRLLPRRGQAGLGLALRGIHPRRARRHRRGEVRAATTRPRLVAQAQAAEQGCDQVVWLDAVEHRWVEEMGGMNLYFVYADGRLRHPGADRHAAARRHPRLDPDAGPDLGLEVEEGRISTDGVARRRAPTGPSPRSSPAAPPRGPSTLRARIRPGGHGRRDGRGG